VAAQEAQQVLWRNRSRDLLELLQHLRSAPIDAVTVRVVVHKLLDSGRARLNLRDRLGARKKDGRSACLVGLPAPPQPAFQTGLRRALRESTLAHGQITHAILKAARRAWRIPGAAGHDEPLPDLQRVDEDLRIRYFAWRDLAQRAAQSAEA